MQALVKREAIFTCGSVTVGARDDSLSRGEAGASAGIPGRIRRGQGGMDGGHLVGCMGGPAARSPEPLARVLLSRRVH